jgi:hypothetical protein
MFCIIIGIQIQQKWKNVRIATPVRSTRGRQNQGLPAASGRKQYIFCAQLSFMQPVTTNRETSNDIEEAVSSKEESTADPVEAHQQVAYASLQKTKHADYFQNKSYMKQ